jgi:hypothetical protein
VTFTASADAPSGARALQITYNCRDSEGTTIPECQVTGWVNLEVDNAVEVADATPLIAWGSTALPANVPANTVLSQFWDTNNVWLPLNNNTVQRLTFNDNLVPWRNQYMRGPNQWFMDASLFKFTNIGEHLTLRLNIDFFNVFNNPNNPTAVTSDGILTTRNSGSPARVTQLTVRLSF